MDKALLDSFSTFLTRLAGVILIFLGISNLLTAEDGGISDYYRYGFTYGIDFDDIILLVVTEGVLVFWGIILLVLSPTLTRVLTPPLRNDDSETKIGEIDPKQLPTAALYFELLYIALTASGFALVIRQAVSLVAWALTDSYADPAASAGGFAAGIALLVAGRILSKRASIHPR